MGWAGKVARTREKICIYKRLAVGKSEGMKQLANLRSGGRIILKYILKNKMRGANRIDVAQDRSQWLAVVFLMRGIFLAEDPST
jgi:hypothetical protein